MLYKRILFLVICLMGMTLGFMFIFALRKHNLESAKIERIPNMRFTSIEGNKISLAEQKNWRKKAILFFSPDCEFCRKEIEEIIASQDSFSGIRWLFMTISSREELDFFLEEYPLSEMNGSEICIVESPEILLALDVKSPPSLFIYNSDGHLEHSKHGAVSIKTILEWLK